MKIELVFFWFFLVCFLRERCSLVYLQMHVLPTPKRCHLPGKIMGNSFIQFMQDPVSVLPKDLQQRAEKMFVASMRYAAEMLTWQHHDVLPRGLKPQQIDNTYVTMLFNDEIHTYQQVSIISWFDQKCYPRSFKINQF